MTKLIKIVVFVPKTHTDVVRQAMDDVNNSVGTKFGGGGTPEAVSLSRDATGQEVLIDYLQVQHQFITLKPNSNRNMSLS